MRIDGPAISPTEVSFPNGGTDLAGFLFVPESDNPVPCLVDNHGSQLPPGTADLSHPQTAAFFMSQGYAYLFPHRAGYGNSSGVKLAQEVTAPRGTPDHDEQMVKRLTQENRDVIASLDYLTTRPDIDAERIVVMGSSLGGIHTLLALAQDKRWRCGLDFSGGASQWKAHPKIKQMLLDAAAALTAPVMLIQPENDFNTAPTEEISALLTELGKPHEAAIFPKWGTPGAEAHRFCAAGQQIWGPMVAAFLEKYL
ncbi:MAG: prolyl oligopeptidase family serine peptidase [Proteobacteria bacterium]|nr:prolyl oligopeptidase family serine peptidase [Pseudomonadota bacterium]MDA1323518.1 prolyl oligopeptidase family serine peptidase [Pseudomonadota bacterium]